MAFGYHVNSGSISDPIVSQSAMNTIDPDMGGHPLDFLAFIERSAEDIKYTPSLERGDLLHTWLEKQDDFVIAELPKPAPQMALFAERFNDLYIKKGYEKTEGFAEYAQGKISVDMNDLLSLNDIFVSFYGRTGSAEDIQLLTRCIFYARKEAEVDKRLTDTKILAKFQEECMAYIRFLQNAGDRYIMDVTTKNILINCHSSIMRHPFAKQFLHESYGSEREIYWQESYGDITLKRKGKLDKCKFENGILTINDFKTTAKPVSQFKTGAYKQYNLGRQLYNYAVAFCSENNLNINEIQLNLFNTVVQTTGNYPTIVYKMSDNEIQLAKQSYESVSNRIVYHIKNNVWEVTMEEHQNGFIMI